MLEKNFLIGFLIFFSTISLMAQDENQNVENLGALTYDSRLSDIWGYATETHEYALVGILDAFSIVDVTDPAKPVELHRVPGAESTWRDIKTWNAYAYVVNETGGGCLIVDMSELPDKIETHNFSGDDGKNFKTAHNVYIDNNGYLYIIGSDYGVGGCLIYDLNENPTEPRFIGVYDAAYVHDAYARDTLLYTFEGGELVIVDISDVANPVILGKATSNGYTHNGWVSDDGTTLFTTDETFGTPVISWDISDPTDIKELDTWQSNPESGSAAHNTFVLGDYIITAYYTDGVTITDVSDPSNMIQVGNYDSSNFSGGSFNGVWGVYPYLPSGNILATDIQNGLFILEPEYKLGGYLNGEVIDAETGEIIEDVKITVGSRNLLTDSSGNFNFAGASDIYNITASKLGYDAKLVEAVEVVAKDTTNIQIALNQQARAYNIKGSILNATNNELAENSTAYFEIGGEQIPVEVVNGNFEIDSLYIGNYNFTAGGWGYYPVEFNLNVNQTNQSFNIYLNEGIYDDFLLDYGWTSENNSETGGTWERVDPVGYDLFGFQTLISDDIEGDFGNTCFVTGDSEALDFVSGGNSTLISPTFDCSAMENPHISFYSYFTNFGYFGPGNKTVDFNLSNGTDTVLIDFDDSDNASTEWKFHNIALKDLIDLNETMQFIVVANGPSGQELLESGIDVFQVVDSAAIQSSGSLALVDDEVPAVFENSQGNSFDVIANDEIVCDNPEYYVVSYNRQYFSNISISETGVLSFDVANFSQPGDYEIVYGVNCGGFNNQTALVKVTIDEGTSIFDSTFPKHLISVSPNPATNMIQIQGVERWSKQQLQVEVYNAKGQKVLTDNLKPDRSIDVNDLDHGLYMLTITENRQIIANSKFIIE